MEVLNVAMAALVEKGQEVTFLIIEDADHPDQFLRFKRHDGVVYGEVGSREWIEPYQPLAEEAVIKLGLLGFTGGGPKRNYGLDGLPVDAMALAHLTEEVFLAGYGRRTGLDVVVSTNSEEVYALLEGQGAWVGQLMSDDRDKVKTVDLGEVERLLKRRGCRVFREADTGYLMTFWGWEEDLGTEIKVWIRLEAEGKVLRISASADRPINSKRQWSRVIHVCNEWNSQHRWPKAYLDPVKLDGKEWGWVDTSVDIPVGAGIHRALVDEVVDEAVGATLRFFRFANEKLDWSTVAAGVKKAG